MGRIFPGPSAASKFRLLVYWYWHATSSFLLLISNARSVPGSFLLVALPFVTICDDRKASCCDSLRIQALGRVPQHGSLGSLRFGCDPRGPATPCVRAGTALRPPFADGRPERNSFGDLELNHHLEPQTTRKKWMCPQTTMTYGCLGFEAVIKSRTIGRWGGV